MKNVPKWLLTDPNSITHGTYIVVEPINNINSAKKVEK